MNIITEKQIINLFQSYSWAELYELIKDVNYDIDTHASKQYNLAFKAMLLVAWWSDDIYSKEILKYFPLTITEPVTYFAVTYSYICLGDKKTIAHYLSMAPKNIPKWMNNYLKLEYLGRSFQNKNQIYLAKQLTLKNKYPINYIKVALLQSLEHQDANISYLANWIKDINLIKDTNDLSIALCLRANCIDIDDITNNTSTILLAKKSIHLLKKRKIVKALKSFDSLAQTKFLDTYSINKWLSLAISTPQGFSYLMQRVDFAIKLTPNSLLVQGTIACYALIHSWIKGDYQLSYNISNQYHKFLDLQTTKLIKNVQVFFRYILYLNVHCQNNKILYTNMNDIVLNVIGESHSLSLSNINITIDYKSYISNTNFIMGIKMYHLANEDINYYSNCLIEYIKILPVDSDVLFTIGEIDTRPDQGIWQVHLNKNKDINEIIEETVSGYIDFLSKELLCKQMNKTIIQGIPAPAYPLIDDKDPKDEVGFLNMIKLVNIKLKELTLNQGWYFLDVYSVTVGDKGISNFKYHIDGYHLKPSFYLEADKWLIKPEPKKQEPVTIDFSKPFNLSKPS